MESEDTTIENILKSAVQHGYGTDQRIKTKLASHIRKELVCEISSETQHHRRKTYQNNKRINS